MGENSNSMCSGFLRTDERGEVGVPGADAPFFILGARDSALQ